MEHRELKFRAWDGKRMRVDGFFIWDGKPHEFSEYSRDDVYKRDWHLMQYTGMKTKDGKDIYEGDIVVADRYPFFNDGVPGYVGVIEWAHAAWYYGLECVNDKLVGSAVGDQLGADGKEVTEFRVIGNIHEHPHLLPSGN